MQYYKAARPLIAAHRGLSSLYPENTLEGLMAALKFSDFIELDVVLSKEKEVIVCHDSYLGLVSDIKKHTNYDERKASRELYGKIKEDWWINDFTLKELKELTVSQCINNRKSEFDAMLKIPTLKEILNAMLEYNSKYNAKKGILLEIKDFDYHITYSNINIAEPVIELLKSFNLNTHQACAQMLPIIIMAFDTPILKYFNQHCNLPLAQLVWFEDKVIPTIDNIVQYAQVIGLDMRLVWQNNQTTEYYEEAKKKGLIIYGWTFQDDHKDLQNLFEENDYGKIYQKSSNLLQGIITEFPQEAVKFIL